MLGSAMKYRLFGIFVSLLLAGCTSIYNSQPGGAEKEAVNKNKMAQTVNSPARGLTPEELESRDDTSIIIREGDNRTIKEYRVGSQLYGFQVIPKTGSPYFLVPADDPNFLIRPDQPERLIPSWQIITWK